MAPAFTIRVLVVSLVAGSLFADGRAAAQTNPGASPGVLWMGPPERARDTSASEVGLVLVEVVVTDDGHNPVTGLPAEAFRIREDGVRQRVASFRAVDIPDSTAPESARSGPPRVSTNAVGANAPSSRVFVVVFDDLHLGPAGALRAREATEQLIAEHTRPGDQVILMVPGEDIVRSAVMPGGRAPLAALTRSLGARREAAPLLTDYEAFRIIEDGDSDVEERVLGRLRDATAPASEEVAPARNGRRGRSAEDVRKEQVEYVWSEGRRVLEKARSHRQRLLSALAAVLEVLTAPRTRKSVILVSEGFIHDPRDRMSYDVIDASQRAGAAIHFLDVRDRDLSPLRGESTGAEILANVTGGYTVQSKSRPSDTLARLSREASHHYVLGYLPSGGRRGGRLRRIHVDVSRPDVVVSARRGYWDAAGTSRRPNHGPPTLLDAPLREALRSSALMRQIPLRLTALALAPADDGRVEVAIASETGARALSLKRKPDGSLGGTLDVVLAISHVRPQASQVASPEKLAVRVPEGARVEETWLSLRRRFTLPPGLCQVKLVVRDRDSGATGTVVHQLEVPERAGLRVSSPILSDLPAGEGVKPPRIVARRGFAAGSVLYCYFEIYPGPEEPFREPAQAGASYEIVDSRGKVRRRAALPLPVPGDGGGLGRLVEIPLADIEPGDYELALDLGDELPGGAAELREPFSVTRPQSFTDDLYRGALSAYREGDFQRAVATLLQWPPRDVLAAAKRLPRVADTRRDTALMLHTDIAMVLRRHGNENGTKTHLAIGRVLLEDAASPDLRREWLLALAYAYQARSRPEEALAFYTECAQAFPEDGEARLGAGTLHERSAFPDGLGPGNLNLSPRAAASEAERSYREALSVQPSLTEARLRLARVLQRTGRADEAVPQLSIVVEFGQDPSLRALAHLFWGEIQETRGDIDGAIERYRRALAEDGDLQVAALALAQNLHRRDGRQAAVNAIVPALGEGGGTSPWLTYRMGPQRLSASPLRELRLRLRGSAGGGR